jgi:hypothetical protein
VEEQNNISHVLRHRYVTEFYVKLQKSAEDITEMLQNACGTEAMS